MCDTPDDYRKLQEHLEELDVRHGCPNNYDVPAQVQVDWHRWAHARTLNAGYFREDSYKWQMDKEVDLKSLVRVYPSLVTRQPTEVPTGLFPQNWPDPEEPAELSTDIVEAKILAALVMDDNDHRTSNDYLVPGFPVSVSTGAE
eukprot:4173212-Amphidinium_carterae.1